jgi:hypothetical protein
MVKLVRVVLLVIIVTACQYIIFAQPEYDVLHSLGMQPDSIHRNNNYLLSFDKAMNTYHWSGIVAYNKSFGLTSINFSERFFSTLISSAQKQIRDEQSFDLSFRHRVIPTLSPAAEISSFVVSNNQAISLGKASSHAFYGGIVWLPVEHLSVEPFIGVRYDNQIDQEDKGISYLLRVSSSDLMYEGYRTNYGGKNVYSNLSPRVIESFNDTLNIEKQFHKQTRNRLQLTYNHNKNDFYFAADPEVARRYNIVNNIETRNENAFSISNDLDYSIWDQLLISFQGNIFSRGIGREHKYKNYFVPSKTLFNTNIEELKINGSIEVKYNHLSGFHSVIRLLYQERDEQHGIEPDYSVPQALIDSSARIEERKNNHSKWTSIATSFAFPLSKSDSIAFSGSGSIQRYDTPSQSNTDDRDELLYAINLSSMHRLNRTLFLKLTAEMNLAHLVYLAGTRSADNSWNRILRFSPRLEYNPSNSIYSMNTFEVLANYTVYDYEFASPSIRSFVFRQFGFIDSTSIALSRHITIKWFSNIRLYERGELQWNDFSERPLNYFEEKMCIGSLEYNIDQSLLFTVGIRYFSQSRSGYNGTEHVPENYLRSVGPLTGFRWFAGERTVLVINGWYESQSQSGTKGRGFANMKISLDVRF